MLQKASAMAVTPTFVPYAAPCDTRPPLTRWVRTRWRGATNTSDPCHGVPNGIARLCDWTVVLQRPTSCRRRKPKLRRCPPEVAIFGHSERQPRHVFVRADPPVLEAFYSSVLPLIHRSTRFVLLTGDSDWTVPRQVDTRIATYAGTQLGAMLDELRRDERVKHWFAENLDTAGLPKLSPLPVGVTEWRPELDEAAAETMIQPSTPTPRVLCVARVPYWVTDEATRRRPEAAQFSDRRRVARLCHGPWADFAHVPAATDGRLNMAPRPGANAYLRVNDAIPTADWIATHAHKDRAHHRTL